MGWGLYPILTWVASREADMMMPDKEEVSMCQNCKVTYKLKFLAYDMKCSLGEGLHKDALGYARQSAQVST